jgi:hypothetical protein
LNQYDVSSILWMQWRKDVVFCFFSFFLPVFSFEFVIFTIWALNLTLSLQIIPPPPTHRFRLLDGFLQYWTWLLIYAALEYLSL